MPAPLLVLVLALSAGRLQDSAGRAQKTPELPPWRTPLGLFERPAPLADEEQLAALGAQLFADPILSQDRSIACVSCHEPAKGFADSRAFSLGVRGQATTRNAPSLLNRAYGQRFMWDGRAATLEEQALLPLENTLEMDLPLAQALERLSADARYRAAFEHISGHAPERETLTRALASYVRRLVLGDSPVDRFRAGDFSALDDAERAGLWFYESRGSCWRCHTGANFTDEEFHNTGVSATQTPSDLGRAQVSGRAEDRGQFKTPSLRGVALTAPYMHDGSLATLADVVEFYHQGGHANPELDPLLAPLEMSVSDAQNLVAFLQALSRTSEAPASR